MKKTSISTEGSNNRLSYMDSYEEIKKYKKKGRGKLLQEFLSREKRPKELILSRTTRWVLFYIFFIIQILMNMDHGTIPAATEDIRNDLKIDNKILGIFGSLVFLGNLIGSIISFTMINCFNRKYMLIISLILNAVCLYTFTVTDIIWILFCNRIIVGVFQAYVSIYLPVWCDQFGIKKRKTMMISLIQAGSPLGVVIGYMLTFLIKKTTLKWSFSFILQALTICVMVIILLFFPSIYFSSVLVSRNRSNSNADIEVNKDNVAENRSVFRDITVTQQASSENRHSVADILSVNRSNRNTHLLKNLGLILRNKVFLFSALALSTLFFIITAVQYWGSDYMAQALKVKDEDMILLSFAVVCVTSPTLGVILGGWTISMIGGYESKHSILLCLIYGIFAGIFGIPVTFTDSLTEFTIYLWLVLFFGGAIVPAITGIIISTVPNNLSGLANSFTSFISNLFGYLPAPFVYGLINNIYQDTNDRLAFFCVMIYSFLGVFFLSLACYLRYKNFDREIDMRKSTRKSLIDDIKYNARGLSHRGSVISDNLQKIFGSYVNLNEMEENLDEDNEEDRSNDVTKNSVGNNINNNNETVMTLDIKTTKKNSSENIFNNKNDEVNSFVENPENSLKRDKFSRVCSSDNENEIEIKSIRVEMEENAQKENFGEEAKNLEEFLEKNKREGDN